MPTNQLDLLANTIQNLHIGKLWGKESIVYGVYRFNIDGSIDILTPPEKIKKSIISSKHRGTYAWFPIGKRKPLYIGQTGRSINTRQREHRSSFKGKSNADSSGRKLNEYLTENKLDFVDLKIKYIDLSKYNIIIPGLGNLIENQSIDYYKPCLNNEISGYGERW